MTAISYRSLWTAWRQRGRQEAFAALVRAELPYALDLARRVGADPAEADDIVQEAMIQLARERSDDPVHVGFRAWIGRRVVLRARMNVRASTRRRRHERSSGEARPAEAAPAPRRLELREEVEAALARLPEEQRQAVVLRYLHDLDYREIAYALGVSENACRLRVHKGLKQLRGLIGGRAPALLASLALPVATSEAAVVKGAVAAAGIQLGVKAGAVAAVAIAVSTTVALVVPEKEPPEPAAVVAQATPPPLRAAPPPERPVAWPPGTALDVLRLHVEGKIDARLLFRDYEQVAAHVPAATGPVRRVEATGPRTRVDLWALVEESNVIEFGPGVFELGGPFRDPPPGGGSVSLRIVVFGRNEPALEIRGAGVDKTTLVGMDRTFQHALDRQANLRLHDFTYDGGPRGDPLIVVQIPLAAVVERVRFRNWNTTSGYWAPIGVRHKAYLAFKECDWSDETGRGFALEIRDEALALFERCRFENLHPVVRGTVGRNVVCLSGCTLSRSVATGPFFGGRSSLEIR